MHVSTAQEAVLDRIGYTLVDVYDDLIAEPLPEPMAELLLERSPTHLPDKTSTNILCKLIEALAHPDRYRFFERNGELFLETIQRD